MKEQLVTFTNKENEKLSGLLHIPDHNKEQQQEDITKGVVLAHCFTCSKHQRVIRTTCENLVKKGFMVLRFDFSGNGDSEGSFEESTYTKQMSDLDSAITFLHNKDVETIGVLGFSMGAGVSILQVGLDKRVKSVCLLAAPADTLSIQTIFPKEKIEEIKENGKASFTIFGRTLVISKEFLEDSKNHDLLHCIKQIKPPVCIIHGQKDTIVPVDHGEKLYDAATEPKELHIIKDSDHMFTKQEHLQEVEEIVVHWFESTL